MKRVLRIVCALALLAAGTASAQIQYGITLSASDTDPRINFSGPLPSVASASVHLWLECGVHDGIAAAEFSLNFDGATYPGMLSWALTMQNGWLNAGTTKDLLLTVGGCPQGPVLAASWGGFNTGAPVVHNFCLIPSPVGNLVGVDCSPTPSTHPVTQVGLAAGTAQGCQDLDCTSSIESDTWGSLKSLYR